MFDLELSTSLLFYTLLPLLFFFIFNLKSIFTGLFPSKSSKLPRSYPIVGSFFAIYANRDRPIQWTSDVLLSSPTATFVLHRPLGRRQVFTANPSNVQHILKSHFHVYQKGPISLTVLQDLLGDGIFNTNGENWKFQRQVSSHEFNTKSLRHFVEHVVDAELTGRLIRIFCAAAKYGTVLDLQDILQRFAFDNVCKIAFGYDAEYLSPSLPETKFAVAFETAAQLTSRRFESFHPLLWKTKRVLQIGSEKQLRIVVNEVRDFAKQIVREKKELAENSSLESADLLSRFLCSGHSDENLITDIVISFILAGRDTTSAALAWFFWLVSRHPDVEKEILREVNEKSETAIYEEVRDMPYTHASLSETMRLYPPVPVDGKQTTKDDVLPDGTAVKKGTRVSYHPYAMGRMERLWGKDWPDFRPERWLKRESGGGKWRYIAADPYEYPVFQAGPRICLGKEMAYLQMKRVAAGVLRRFRVVPTLPDGEEPVYISYFTAKMKGTFPVRIEERSKHIQRR
ncbi:hypothetical protein NMG60_11014085 [Bertholletia excelsa]